MMVPCGLTEYVFFMKFSFHASKKPSSLVEAIDDTLGTEPLNQEAQHIEMKVVSVSKNTNSFGLRGIVLVSKDRKAYEVGRSTSASPQWVKDDVVKIPLDPRGNPNWARAGVEIPKELGPVPDDVFSEVWN